MKEREVVRVTNAALDELNGEIVLRGVLDPASLRFLKVDDYQREVIRSKKIAGMKESLQSSLGVPDIDLGMRGGDYGEKAGAFELRNDVYIVDGFQRKTAATEALRAGFSPRLGATIHFNTTYKWEKDRFRLLNSCRVGVSPNIHLRNMVAENTGIALLHQLSMLDTDFPLNRRVCWDQQMKQEHLTSALQLLKTSALLHCGFAPGLMHAGYELLALAFERLVNRLGRGTVAGNIKTFWQVLDECWSIKQIHFKEHATPIKLNFLAALAKLVTDHANFWKDSRLALDSEVVHKLQSFPVNDPNVINLAGSAGKSRNVLYELLRDHLNSGKRINRLVRRVLREDHDHTFIPQQERKIAAVV